MTKPFVHGDLVFIGEHSNEMKHFPSNQYGVVDFSYAERYGGTRADRFNYSLVLASGPCAWFPHSCLTLKSDVRDREPYNQWVKRQVKKIKELNK